jgi:hypothetical protein
MLAAMDTRANGLWKHIHATARELARQQSIPSARHAEAIVEQIIRKERSAIPAGHTAASLAKELVRAILEAVPRTDERQKMS